MKQHFLYEALFCFSAWLSGADAVADATTYMRPLMIRTHRARRWPVLTGGMAVNDQERGTDGVEERLAHLSEFFVREVATLAPKGQP